MPEPADDPMAELFRHGSTHVQTVITGAARIVDQRSLRTSRVLQQRSQFEAQAAERARAEMAALTDADTARRRQHTALVDQADTVADTTERHITSPTGLAADLVAAAYPAGVPTTAAAATAVARTGRLHHPAPAMPSDLQPGIDR